MNTFQLIQTSGQARLGLLKTFHAEIETPAFMAVGTAATVKAMDPDELWSIGARQIVCNTYHLYLRPGHELIAQKGGLHRFMGWKGSILTDSGGYQAFSLGDLKKISDEGVRFRSHIDGSYHNLTPELSMDIQKALGSDIVMMLDECAPYPCTETQAIKAVQRTTAWARRCKERFELTNDGKQLLFPIIQGSMFKELRLQSLAELSALELPGMAIGGLSVGESTESMLGVLDWLVPEMPQHKLRYLMGVGRPIEILEAVARGVDMFDCVLPTRMARNGAVFTSEGRITIKNSRYKLDDKPLDPECACSTCARFSRSYLRHLYTNGEILSAMLLTHHNLHFYLHLMERIRSAIKENRFSGLYEDLKAALQEPDSRIDRQMDKSRLELKEEIES